MKTAVISSPLIASKNMQGSIMGMDANGTAMASMFLRDKIYSNKVLAVVREYGCNGIDEHKKHGIQRPVEMGLRKEGNDTIFFVRDFAKGLNEDDIRNVFGMYFRSTKSGTNEMIGGFGIGSKAGHCYNDTFFVTSFHEGVKKTFTCMLGGSDSGVPVGHIYEIGEGVQTQESGLEISMPVDYLDINRFTNEITNFVRMSPSGIKAYLHGNTVESLPSVFSTKLGEYSVRLVEHPTTNSSVSAVLQMGGVTYGNLHFTHGIHSVKARHTLIVDVPVGSMSIPISRESFEETPDNQRAKDKILNLLAQFADKDVEKFKDKTMEDLVTDFFKNNDRADASFNGDVFSVRKSTLYKNEWGFLTCLALSGDSSIDPEKKDGKRVLVVIPENMAEKYWRAKVRDFSATEKKNYFFTNDRVYARYTQTPEDHKKITDVFNMVRVKSLPFPKVKRDTKRYAIYTYNGSIGSKTPLELHNHIAMSKGLPVVSTIKEAQKQCQKIIKEAKSKRDLREVVIADKTTTSRDPDRIGYYTCSLKFQNEMKELGWLAYPSTEYDKKHTEIVEIEKVEAEKRNALIYAKKRWLQFSDRTHRLMNDNSRNAMRILKVWQGLSKENSTRAKVLKSIENSGYGSNMLYTRKDLRSILSLK